MKETRMLMGMPITVEIQDAKAKQADIDAAFDYFEYIDEKFSPFKETSEITQVNQGSLAPADYSPDMATVFRLCQETEKLTHGYFNIVDPSGQFNPSGLVKGWAIHNVAKLLAKRGCKIFYVDAGGDIEVRGNKHWKIGLRNPFGGTKMVKVVYLKNAGIATSGTYLRGDHIYNPKKKNKAVTELASLTVIGPNIYEADRFATAAYAMGMKGIEFIENLPKFEGYSIDKDGRATLTSNFAKYTVSPK